MLSLLFGFLLGVLAVIAAEAYVLLSVIDRLRRRGEPKPLESQEGHDVDGEQSLAFPYNKQGVVWVLESEKVPKVSPNGSPTKGPKEQKNKKEIVEVSPVKKYAKIKDHSLILSDLDGSTSETTIELADCTIAAVSASNLASRKWAKRYPIRVESKKSVVFNRSKTCYLYLDTSWEKESWCKVLRLASGADKKMLNWFAQLNDEFNHYLTSLNAEYPSFLKPSVLFGEATDRTNRIDGSSSKVRVFLKKLAKKASKTGAEPKTSSVSSSTRGERKSGDKSRALPDISSTTTFVKASSADKSTSSSSQDLVQPSSPTSSHLGNKNLLSVDAVCDEKLGNDEGTLCLNLLFSRLFFDAKRSTEMNSLIKTRIQRTLSNMRTPSYIGGVTCIGLNLGNLPPYIHSMRVLPMDMNEVWAVEVDIEYSGGVILDIETRLEVCEPEFQKGIINTSFEPSSAGEATSDLLEGFEHYGNQLKLSGSSADGMENIDDGDTFDRMKQSKSTGWSSTYASRWKAIVHSIAEQVSQVPLSLVIRVASLRGTLRLHIKPPPSDQLWFGFTSMPEIDWDLDSSVGDRKIASARIALLISNRFKAAIRDTLVLPNCEYINIPWMLAEKDDWVPRKMAPFVWVKQEAVDVPVLDASKSQSGETKVKLDGSNENKAGSSSHVNKKDEKVKEAVFAQPPPQESASGLISSQTGPPTSASSHQSSHSSGFEELRIPLLRSDETQESSEQCRVESPVISSSGVIVSFEEPTTVHLDEDMKPKKIGRRARMMDLGKKMGEKLEEKRRQVEEKGRNIVEKMRENTKT